MKKHIVMTFGRMNPPTIGHAKLVEKIRSLARETGADSAVYLSRTDDKKNPLPYDKKLKYVKLAFGDIVKKSPALATIFTVLQELEKTYNQVTLVLGSDRVRAMTTLLDSYNGKDFHFDSINVVSAGERDPDADEASAMSASKMRQYVRDDEPEAFKAGLPKKLQSISAEVFAAVKSGL